MVKRNSNEFREEYTILFVCRKESDDESVFRMIFEEAGYRFLSLTRVIGRITVKEIKRASPDLIMLEEQVDSLDICQKLKIGEQTKNIPIILLFRSLADGSIEQATEAGVDDFLISPILIPQMLERVQGLVSKYRSKRDSE